MTELIETTVSDNKNRKLRPLLPNFNDEKKGMICFVAKFTLIFYLFIYFIYFFFWCGGGERVISFLIPTKIVALKGGSFLTYLLESSEYHFPWFIPGFTMNWTSKNTSRR